MITHNCKVFPLCSCELHGCSLLQGSPPLPRNVPPVAGAVAWVRQLLRRVEGPMEIFRNDTTVMQSVVSDIIYTPTLPPTPPPPHTHTQYFNTSLLLLYSKHTGISARLQAVQPSFHGTAQVRGVVAGPVAILSQADKGRAEGHSVGTRGRGEGGWGIQETSHQGQCTQQVHIREDRKPAEKVGS